MRGLDKCNSESAQNISARFLIGESLNVPKKEKKRKGITKKRNENIDTDKVV